MNVLSMGMPFGTTHAPIDLFQSKRGHAIRLLAAEGTEGVELDTAGTSFHRPPDYTFGSTETAAAIVERIANDWSPDALICWVPEMFPPPRAIEHCPIRTVAIVSDWNIYYPQLEYNLARYDVVLTDRLGAQTLSAPGAQPQFLFPIYSHLTPVHRRLDVDKDIDVAFVGNLNHAVHCERGRYLEQVAGLSDRRRVMIRSGVFGEEYARLLNRARIVLNCALRREMNLRCFEALACNALLFVGEDNLEVPDWLEDRQEVVLYRQDNLVDLIEHYLTHPEEAERITRQGRDKVAALAGEHRLDALVDWIADQPAGARAFRTFPEDQQAYAEVMQYASSVVPKQRAAHAGAAARYACAYPDRLEFRVAAASDDLGGIPALPEGERPGAVRQVLDRLKEACIEAQDSAVLWHNLAFVCRHAGATLAERRCLELTLEAGSSAYGGLLMGDFAEPYYAASRRALALGAFRVEMVWAAAAARLAHLELEQHHYPEARDLAAKSVEWLPEIPVPHRVRAVAESRLGHVEEAARILAEALPLTAFDAEYRGDLIQAWQALGQREKARGLAVESARLFAAYWGAEPLAQTFREVADAI